MNDVDLATDIAREAGQLLLSIRAERAEEGQALGDRGDREANAMILGRLADARPDDFVLSEESTDDRRRCGAKRVWIIDPLDGTRDYAEERDDWAVHIGLAIDGQAAVGAVAVPELNQVWSSGAAAVQSGGLARLRILVSRTRCPERLHRIGAALGAELIGMGSAGAKAMAVLDGRADAYLHEGGQYEWDNCAPVAVALAAGLHASRLDGSPLVYNRPDPSLPDLLICRRELAPILLRAIAEASGPARSSAS